MKLLLKWTSYPVILVAVVLSLLPISMLMAEDALDDPPPAIGKAVNDTPPVTVEVEKDTPPVKAEVVENAAPAMAEDCSLESIELSFGKLFPKKKNAKIASIQKHLKIAGFHPGRIDERLGDDTGLALSQFCRSTKIDIRLKETEKDGKVEDLANLVIERLTVVASGEDESTAISLDGGDCGCSRDFSAQMYGFYPYWLADAETQVVDFSLYDRIGYFGLTLDAEGRLVRELHWPVNPDLQQSAAGFINQAHRHKVKVDLGFKTTNWHSWDSLQRFRAMSTIIETATRKYKNADSKRWRKWLPLVEDYSFASVDGVNLFFDDYQDSTDGQKINDFVGELAVKLKQAKPDVQLNIMLGLNLADVDKQRLEDNNPDAVVGKQYKERTDRLGNLVDQFRVLGPILDSNPKTVDRVFVFLTQDTSKSKKICAKSSKTLFAAKNVKSCCASWCRLSWRRG